MALYDGLRRLLFALDAERSHRLTLASLNGMHKLGLTGLVHKPPERLSTRVFGLDFPNPVGLAAGLDKNADHIDALAALGFGFIEVGTVTPRPQAGKPRPRLFRLVDDQAIVNRMGFNNAGIDTVMRNIEASEYRGILGINIGRNADTPPEHALADYLMCLRVAWPSASYITVNISSPNTEGLRDLQKPQQLQDFVATLMRERDALVAEHGRSKPLLVKIAPDLSEAQMDAMARIFNALKPDGLICTNTTISRPRVAHAPEIHEAGGLSGLPLRTLANQVLQGMRERLDDGISLVGTGGIVEGDDAAEKIHLGAQLVQIYSGLVFRGPHLIGECVNELRRQFRKF